MFVVFIIVHSFEMVGSAPWQRMLLDVNATHSPHVRRHRGHKRSTCWRRPSLQSSDPYSCKKSALVRVCARVQMLCLFLAVRMSSVYAVNKIALSLCAPASTVVLEVSARSCLSCFLPERTWAVPHLECGLFVGGARLQLAFGWSALGDLSLSF